MITAFVLAVAILSLIPALNGLLNLVLLRTPAPQADQSVAILIPARDEEAVIATCVEAALATRGIEFEVIVLDDGSRDRTRAILDAIAVRDPRLRVIEGAPLGPGLKGKPAACQRLAEATDRPLLLFVDADVVLAPEAAARLALPAHLDLVSGVPRQRLEGFIATAVVPMILTLLIAYLPLGAARIFRHRRMFAAACGQLLMVRASAYRACGGHSAVGDRMHEAMALARRFRRLGFSTDLVDATRLATCRMYTKAADVFAGFGKNATEGMARPLALPIWTILLVGGHLMPFVAIPLALMSGQGGLIALSLAATLLLVAARCLQKLKCAEPWAAVLLHPLGVFLTLVIQYIAFIAWLRGRRIEWKGRSYAPQL
jgi:hypothetical protein